MSSSPSPHLHFLSSALQRLVALDEGDGLLNFQTILQPITRDYEGSNAPLLIAIAVCGGLLQFLVRHTIIRVLGTCLVTACFENSRGCETSSNCSEVRRSHDEAEMTASGVFTLLRKLSLLRTRVRRSILYASIYSIALRCCCELASAISDSYFWLRFAEVAIVVSLEPIHLRWTRSIVMRTPRTVGAPYLSWGPLLRPAMIYAVAQTITAQLPATVDRWFAGDGVSVDDMAASKDVTSLLLALALRFCVLYPAWASLIYFETRRENQEQDDSEDGRNTYIHIVKICYQKVLLRLAGLHLQTAGVMIVIELGTYIIFHSLLSMPLNSA